MSVFSGLLLSNLSIVCFVSLLGLIPLITILLLLHLLYETILLCPLLIKHTIVIYYTSIAYGHS